MELDVFRGKFPFWRMQTRLVIIRLWDVNQLTFSRAQQALCSGCGFCWTWWFLWSPKQSSPITLGSPLLRPSWWLGQWCLTRAGWLAQNGEIKKTHQLQESCSCEVESIQKSKQKCRDVAINQAVFVGRIFIYLFGLGQLVLHHMYLEIYSNKPASKDLFRTNHKCFPVPTSTFSIFFSSINLT